MLTLQVSGMTCGGCINAITRAIQAQDAQAQVQVDLSTQSVTLNTTLSAAIAARIIADAGFPVLE